MVNCKLSLFNQTKYLSVGNEKNPQKVTTWCTYNSVGGPQLSDLIICLAKMLLKSLCQKWKWSLSSFLISTPVLLLYEFGRFLPYVISNQPHSETSNFNQWSWLQSIALEGLRKWTGTIFIWLKPPFFLTRYDVYSEFLVYHKIL